MKIFQKRHNADSSFINCGDSTFLRRPISICDAENGKVRFIFEVKGKGTEELAKKEVGDYM